MAIQFNNLKNYYNKVRGRFENIDTYSKNDTFSHAELRQRINNLGKILDDYEYYLSNNYIDFEAVCDNFPDALYVSDKRGKTMYVNDTYESLSGISKSEVIGKNIYELNEEGSMYSNGILPSIIETGERGEKVGVMKRTNTAVHITGYPIFDVSGELRYAVAYDRDIQQLQNARDQLAKLKEAANKKENEIEYLRSGQIKNREIVFKSIQLDQVISTALSVADTDTSVLITGESGTGKEVIANTIYQNSNRSNKTFLKINCAAIPESLMESELFGYEPGAFTGASRHGKTGIFELASGGTLLLDEIGEMSLSMQTKLLRVLQNHEIVKVGGSTPIPVDVRIISATNRNLLEAIKEKTFREDLYYRLNVVPIIIPSLRDRKEDIAPLVDHFLSRFTKKYNKQIEISDDAVSIMEAYDWPGNIRELENVVERLVVINEKNYIDKNMLSMVLGIRTAKSKDMDDESESYDIKAAVINVEKKIIRRALREFPSKRKAAEALGIDHSTLVKKCQRYGL